MLPKTALRFQPKDQFVSSKKLYTQLKIMPHHFYFFRILFINCVATDVTSDLRLCQEQKVKDIAAMNKCI